MASTLKNKENISDRIESSYERSQSIKTKAIRDAETNWQVSTSKEHSLDCSQPGSDVGGIDQLGSELEAILSSVDGENSLSNLLHNNENQRIVLEKQLSEAKAVASGMQLITGLGRDMEEVDEFLSLGEFKSGVSSIISLEEKISKVREVGFGQLDELNKVVDLVESQLRMRRASASASLRSLWRTAIHIERDIAKTENNSRSFVVHMKLEGKVAGQQLKKPIPLEQLWWCLERLGVEGLLGECCDYLSRNCLLALVSNEIENIRHLQQDINSGRKEEFKSSLTIDTLVDSTGSKSVLNIIPMAIDQTHDNEMDTQIKPEQPEMHIKKPEVNNGPKSKAVRVLIQREVQESPDSHLTAPMRSFLVFLRDVAQALEFIAENVFNGSLRYCAKAGVHLFGQGSDQGEFLRALFAVMEVATESHELGDVDALKLAVSELEQKAFDLGFLADLPSSQKECGLLDVSSALPAAPLSVFVAKLPIVWANRMREKVLEEARSRLVSGDYHNSVASEGFFKAAPDTPLHFPPCQVTATCADLLRSANATLEAACSQDDPLPALTLFRTARELLDLFRAVVPQRHSEALSSLPRLAALFHNDCLFLSHACLTLTHPYRNRLPAPLNKTATCVDLSSVLREVGEQTLLRQIAVQQVQLDSFAQTVESWVPEDETHAGPEATVKGCIFHLHHLAHLWQPCLSAEVYNKVMGRLLKHASMPLLAAIVSVQDIAESATHRLHRVLSDIVTAKDALIIGGVDGEDQAGLELGAWWNRLCALKDLMVWSLDDINEQLSAGTFRNFSSPELCHVLEALFEPSEKLERTLTAVRKG